MSVNQRINTGSMADIAFLLLIFFLVTTHIQQDYAINTHISKPFDIPDSVQVQHSTLAINSNGKYMLNNKPVAKPILAEVIAKEFNEQRYVKNVIVVKTERNVVFDDFILGLNESKKAFKLFYNNLAHNQYQEDYNMLSDSLRVQLKLWHPIALAEDVLED